MLSASRSSRAARRRRPSRTRARPALDGGFIDVVEHDLVAGLERELGDPGAHRPGSDHADDPASRRRRDGWARSDRLEVLERLAAGRAVVDRAALGRAEEVLEDRPSRAAVRAGHDRGRAAGGPARPAGRRRAARTPPRAACGGPRGVIRSEVHGHPEPKPDVDRPTEDAQAILDGAADQVERRTTDKRRQELHADPGRDRPRRVRPSRGPRRTPSGAPGRARPRARRERWPRRAPADDRRPARPAADPRPAARDRGVDRGLAHHVTPGSARGPC